jgi:hypothetical protein
MMLSVSFSLFLMIRLSAGNAKLKYIRLREKVIKEISAAKSRYLKTNLDKKEPKSIWKAIHGLTGKSKQPSVQADVEALNDGFLTSQQVSNSSYDLQDLIEHLPSSPISVSCEQAIKILQAIPTKAAGPESVPAWVFRSFSLALAPAVAKLFTASLSQGIVPQCYKMASILPIPKGGNCLEFRPISLLPHLSKALEKVVRSSWLKPVLSHLDPNQFAFTGVPGCGTTTALTSINTSILQHLDSSSGASRVLMVDFSKAFDKADHGTILKRLANLKVPRECLLWIANFLSHRQQRVSLSGNNSQWKSVKSGVPQGSVLGPPLFAILVSSIVSNYPNVKIVKYADDITLICHVRSVADDVLQLELNALCKWSDENLLPINFTKTKVLDICTKKGLCLSPLIGPGGAVIENVSEARLLGIILASNLKWNKHVDFMAARARRQIYAISMLKWSGAPAAILWGTYSALIRSLLTYAFPAICNMPKTLFEKLGSIERRVGKIIGAPAPMALSAHTQELCTRLAAVVAKNARHPLHHLVIPTHRRGRSSNKYTRPFAHTERFKRSFIHYISLS